MRKLTQLWRALEKVPGLTDIPAAWELHCGGEFPLLRPHLHSTDVLGYRYPCAPRHTAALLHPLPLRFHRHI